MAGKPYNKIDNETKIDASAKELSFFISRGACGGVTEVYQTKNKNLQLTKTLKQNMEDGKCMESTYEVSNGTEKFMSKRELK